MLVEHLHHRVEFFEDAEALGERVAQFLLEGMRRGSSGVAIARAGVDVATARSLDKLVMIDAQDVIDTVVVDGRADGAKFRALASSRIPRAATFTSTAKSSTSCTSAASARRCSSSKSTAAGARSAACATCSPSRPSSLRRPMVGPLRSSWSRRTAVGASYAGAWIVDGADLALVSTSEASSNVATWFERVALAADYPATRANRLDKVEDVYALLADG